jgi:hypothetical protein
VLIQAALNGGTSRSEHPAVPVTPAELAVSAREAQAAGATVIHIHPRDSSGAQTLVSDHVLAAVSAVREATGLPVGVTTGIWTVDGEPDRRLALAADWAGRSVGVGWSGKPGLDERYRVWRIVIDSGGSVMPFATDEACVVPVTILEFVAFWLPAL